MGTTPYMGNEFELRSMEYEFNNTGLESVLFLLPGLART